MMGKQVFERECAACHSLLPEAVIVGPPLAGIGGEAATRVEGQDARTYLLTSIMRPEDYLVDGYENLMPQALGKTLSGEEVGLENLSQHGRARQPS